MCPTLDPPPGRAAILKGGQSSRFSLLYYSKARHLQFTDPSFIQLAIALLYCSLILEEKAMAMLGTSPVMGAAALLLPSGDSAELRQRASSRTLAYPKQRSYTTIVRSSRLPLNPREAREMSEGREPERPNEGGAGAGPNPLRFFQNFKDGLFADHKRIQREKNLPKGDLLYTVEKGDTLYAISDRHDCSLELLMEANGIEDPHNLHIGQEIWIPRTYQIKKGDTLYSISNHYGVSMEAIQRANGIDDPNFIREGDHICLPENTDDENSD